MPPTPRPLLAFLRLTTWLALVLSLLVGCGRTELAVETDAAPLLPDGDIPPDGPSGEHPDVVRRLVSISITPQAVSLPVGTSQSFMVTGTWSDGYATDLTELVEFSLDAPGVLSLRGHVVTARAPGLARLSARTPTGLSVTAMVSVPAAEARALAVSPELASTGVGATLRYTAIASLSDASRHDVSSLVLWRTSDPSVAVIDASGLARAVATGTVTVSATLAATRTLTASVTLTVTAAALASIVVNPALPSFPSGVRQRFSALGTYTDGSTADVSGAARWTSSIPSVVSLDPSGEGLMGLPGRATVSATLGRVVGATQVTVTAARLLSIEVSSVVSTLPLGVSRALHAVGTYSDGSSADLTSVAVWSSSDASVATASNAPASRGTVTATAVGTTTVSATLDGFTGSATVTVTSATLSRISVLPAGATFPPGIRVHFTATASYSDGSTADVTTGAVWSSATARALLISPGGLGTTLFPGASVVTAALGRVSGSTEVTVSTASITGLRVNPWAATVPTRGAANFRATGVYSDGTTQDLTDSVVWESSERRVATVFAGHASGLAPGTANVSARYFTQSASAVLRVTEATLTAIELSPASASLALGGVSDFHAVGTFSDRSTADVTAMASWTSSAPAVVSVSNLSPQRGVVVANSPGAAVVSATIAPLHATASVTVSDAATLSSLEIDPADSAFPVGTRRAFRATGVWSDGTHADVSALVTWDLAAPAFTRSGAVVTAVAPGTATLTATLGPRQARASVRALAAVASLSVSPAAPSLPRDGRLPLRATATLADGAVADVTPSVSWTSARPSVAVVDAGGGLTGVSSGTTTVTATLGSLSAATTVTVTDATLRALQVSPVDVALGEGVVRHFRAYGIFSDGSAMALTNAVRWSTSSPSVLTLDPSGRAVGRAPGTAVVTASLAGLDDATTVTVSPVGLLSLTVSPATRTLSPQEVVPLRATATWSDGTASDVTDSVAWRSSIPSVVSVSNAFEVAGHVTALAAGTTNVIASFRGQGGRATITVSPAALRLITLSVPSLNLAAGQRAALSAVGHYADDSLRDVTALVQWQSSDPSVASVGEGFVVGEAPGRASLRATLRDVAAEASVTVGAATLRAVALGPTGAVVRLGDRLRLAATGTWSDGSTAVVTSQCSFVSDDPAVAAVSNDVDARGELVGRAEGSVGVSARCLGVSARVGVSVRGPTLTSLLLTPAGTSAPVGVPVQFSAVGRYSDGVSRNLTAASVWTSTAPFVAAIDDRGLVAPRSPGSTLVSAAAQGMSASVTFSVTPATVAAVRVTPVAATLAPGASLQLQAVAVFSDGSTRTVTSLAAWSSSSPSVLSLAAVGVSPGRAVALAPGVSSVIATFGDSSGSAELTVSAATLTSVSVSPSSAAVAAMATRQFAASARYSDGSVRDVTALATWTSSDPRAGVVSDAAGSRGLFSARDPGTTVVTASYMGLSGLASATVTAIAPRH